MKKKPVQFVPFLEPKQDFLENIQTRKIEQKFFYLGEGAERYYSLSQKKDRAAHGYPTTEELVNFITPHLDPNKTIYFTSLGCGNSQVEIDVVKQLQERYDVVFVAVDYSEEMLAQTEAALADTDISYQLLCADFSARSFREEIANRVSKDIQSVFTFFGGTFGNVSQTKMVDTLYNIMGDDDLLMIGIRRRTDISKEQNLRIFEKYANFLQDEDRLDFYLGPLKNLGICPQDGKMKIKSTEDVTIGILSFRFYFELNKPVTIVYEGDTVHLLPNQPIQLQTIRAYHVPTFRAFFEKNDFDCLLEFERNSRGMFVFQKKHK